MKISEIEQLKAGDLVTVTAKHHTKYKGLVLEVVNTERHSTRLSDGTLIIDPYPSKVVLKQPGYDLGFRLKVQGSMISRYEG